MTDSSRGSGRRAEKSANQAEAPTPAYRIEDLAHLSGTTVRTIRAYQDRGVLPRPERRGRANVYADTHLVRLRQIADLLDRGYGCTSGSAVSPTTRRSPRPSS